LTVTAKDAANNTGTDTLTVTYTTSSTGLIAAYGFGENGGSTAADASGNGNTASIFGGTTWVSGHTGSGLSFDGTSGYSTAPTVPYVANWTVSAWVRSPAAPSASNNSGPVNRDSNFQINWNHTNAAFRAAAGVYVNGNWYPASFGSLSANTWYFLAATYDGETLNAYANGVLVTSNSAPSGPATSTGNPLTLGKHAAASQFFQGTIDDVRIYDHALSVAQIQTDMNTPVSGGGGGGDTTPPSITITSPTSNPTYTTNTSPLAISGTASDNVGVTQVTWSNSAGGSGTASGTTNWSVSGITLQPGTNVVTVTAYDAATNTGTDTLTVTYTVSSTGLVAAYGFSENGGSTTADASGNGNTANILGGTTWVSGHSGSGLSFDGTSGYSTAPTVPYVANWTVSAWVLSPAAPSASNNSGPVNRDWNFQINWNHSNAAFRGAAGVFVNGNWYAASFGSLSANTWYFLAATYDGETLNAYTNGALVTSNSAPSGPATSTGNPLTFGKHAAASQFFQGAIDDVRIYDHALSQAAIQTDMSTPVTGGGPDPSQVGQWSPPFALPAKDVHNAIFRNGSILFWDAFSFGHEAYVWNPDGTFTYVPSNDNIFCAGLTLLADGNALLVGGHITGGVGIPDANRFDPVSKTWIPENSMTYARWYPTATSLGDGRVLVTSGSTTCVTCIADIPEIYNPSTNTWTQLPGAQLSMPLYPHMFLLPDGRILYASSTEATIQTQVLNLNTQTWSMVDPVAVNGGSSAMYRPGKILKSGSPGAPNRIPVAPSTSTAYVLDMNQQTPAWRSVQPMAFPRTFHTLTILPDGSVLATGGSETNDPSSQPVYAAEIWNAQTETWTTMSSMQMGRTYHETALLMADGRIFVAGGGGCCNAPDQFNAEIFSPPYLFKGARPTITSAPANVSYGTQSFIGTPNGASIQSVAFMRLGAQTHQFDMSQRYVSLSFTQTSGGLNVTWPANGNLAPPGDYMVFIVNSSGVPSVAANVNIH
jgi:hypothetical protein